MYELIIVVIFGLVAIVSVVVVNVAERRQWAEDRKDLLNRIMARDYREFSSVAETTQPAEEARPPIKVVSVEELRRDLEEDERGPLGMPV